MIGVADVGLDDDVRARLDEPLDAAERGDGAPGQLGRVGACAARDGQVGGGRVARRRSRCGRFGGRGGGWILAAAVVGAAPPARAVGGMAVAVGRQSARRRRRRIGVAASGVGREPQPARPQAAPAADTANSRLMKARRSSLWVMIGLLAGSQDNLVWPSYQSGRISVCAASSWGEWEVGQSPCRRYNRVGDHTMDQESNEQHETARLSRLAAGRAWSDRGRRLAGRPDRRLRPLAGQPDSPSAGRVGRIGLTLGFRCRRPGDVLADRRAGVAAGRAGELRRLAASAGRGGAALWTVQFVLQVLDLFGVPELFAFLWRAVTRASPLTGDEIVAATSVLGPFALRFQDIRVAQGGVLRPIFRRNGDRAFATFHTVNLPATGDHERSNVAILLHELVHVYQYERAGSRYFAEALLAQHEAGYDYGGAGGSATGVPAGQASAGLQPRTAGADRPGLLCVPELRAGYGGLRAVHRGVARGEGVMETLRGFANLKGLDVGRRGSRTHQWSRISVAR